MKVTYGELFRNRGFAALWIGQTVSAIGDTFNLTSLYFLMMAMNKGSGASSATPLMINTAAYLLISPFAGAFADRWDRKKTMIAVIVLPHVPAVRAVSLAENVKVLFKDMREGLAYVSRHRIVQGLFLTNFILVLCMGAYNAIEPVFVGETLGGGVTGFGLVAGIMTLSFMVGTLLFGGVAHRLNQFSGYSWGTLGMGLGILGIGSSPNIPVVMGMAFAFGMTNPFYYISQGVIMQSNVENHILGGFPVCIALLPGQASSFQRFIPDWFRNRCIGRSA